MSEAIGGLVARANAPLFVVTTVAAGERAGCVVGFATQASIDPARFLVCISTKNRTWQIAESATHLVVHLFGRERMDVVDVFGGEERGVGPAVVVILDGAAAWFVGRIVERFAFGDHVGHLLEPVAGGTATTSSAAVTLHDADDLEPGHPA